MAGNVWLVYASDMKQPIPLTRDLLLIGGGHTHALVLRRWGMNPLPGVRVSVVNPGSTAAYSGMLPGFVAGHYGRDDLDIDLVQLARFAGARLIAGRVIALDPATRQVTLEGGRVLAFDVASVDIGITSNMPDLPGFADHAIPAKPLGRFATAWDTYRARAEQPECAVIGGGVAGAELAMAMAFALRDRRATISLIDRGQVLEELGPPARKRLLAALAENRVALVENAEVAVVDPGGVRLGDGRVIPSSFTIGAAGARSQGWLAQTGLDTHQGFLTVGPTLQCSDPDIFAVGDCAHLSHAPRPKAGVYAVREAPVLYANLRARLSGRTLRRYQPQRDYLKLISLGRKSALAERLGTAFKGPLLWRLKDRIDRKFMLKFRDLPIMAPDLPRQVATGVGEMLADGPACSGCGAKVGRGTLQATLTALPATSRADVTQLPGDDAAVLTMGQTRQVISTDHLGAVTEDPVLMAEIATIHALGDIWAMGAAPQAGLLNITLPRMSEALQARTVAEISRTVARVLTEAGAALVGGHTTQGADLMIGLTVTGLCDAAPITLSGAGPGDALILTKPIGIGTILAAEMRGKARGADVLACHAEMIRPQGKAAAILSGAHAMTDVTGFGLAGHLAGMCTASGTGAELSAVPCLDGAEALAAAGIRSSLFEDNRAGAGPVTGSAGPVFDLLFDPQTCGGLLAAVDAAQAEGLVAALHKAGYTAARIGQMTTSPGIRLL